METIKITINEISPDDWLQMRSAVSFPVFEKQVAQKALDGSLAVLGIKKDEKYIGMLRILGDGAYSFYFNDVIIIPDFQKKGLGKRLISEAFDYIRTNYCKDTMFSVSLFANIMSEGFYEKVGFSVREEVPMKIFVKDIYKGTRKECLNKILFK